MSTNAPKIEAIRLVAAKIETTTGTEISVTASDATLIFYNPTLVPDDPANEREQPGAQGQNVSTPGLQTGTFTGEVDLCGSGTAGTSPSFAEIFLPACDMKETSGTWAVALLPADRMVTLTIAIYEDGLKRILYGARGDWEIKYEDGKPPRMAFTFKGKYKEDADAAILAPTFPTVVPPVFGSSGTSLLIAGTYSPIISTFSVKMGNQVEIRENANATDGTGLYGAAITQKKPEWSGECEAEPTSARDWRGIIAAQTQESLTIVVGATAGNIVTVSTPSGGTIQTTKAGRGSKSGILTRTPSGIFVGPTFISIAFG